MIYESAHWANAESTLVTGTNAKGQTETVPSDYSLFRQPDDGPAGFLLRGGVIGAYQAPAASPPDLLPYQFRAMLTLSGKQDDLDAFIESMPDPDRIVAKAKLEYSLVFERHNDLVVAARQALGLTDEELDLLWLQASSI